MEYRNRPEGDPMPVKTNWSVVPANDNNPEEIADFGFERDLRITPSVQEIMRHAATGDEERNDKNQIVRIGKLRFSDGTQTEKAFTLGPDGSAVQYDRRMPAGAMLGTREKAETQLGGKGYTQAQNEQSNLYFAAMLGTIEPRYVKRGKRKNGRSLSADESRAELAKAVANTKAMPKITKLRPGLPCGGERVADSFVGMRKGKKGESGAMMWQDMCSAIVDREIWEETLAALNDEDRATLDATMAARSVRDLAPGKRGGNAYIAGSTALSAANDNLTRNLKRAYR
ncbi:hypothetical protein ACFPOD_04975 [Nitratireductor kimnyeongensis]|uniref:Uncharacterized protein n=1 Tax=Nitratireductor kimnyeongensis TaxID=430679 RepID=A0ABW0T632_9HYPH|nr:hypothetical protein [Nitratireductor kimnyeongensis]